jgi:hypothetical protein
MSKATVTPEAIARTYERIEPHVRKTPVLAVKAQGHDGGICVCIFGVLILKEQVFHERHAFGTLERQVRGHQRVESRLGLRVFRFDSLFEHFGVRGSAANAEHSQVQSPPAGRDLWVLDPLDELIVLHLAFHVPYATKGDLGEFVVGVASQHFVAVFEIFLKEGQPLWTLFGEAQHSSKINPPSVRHRHRRGPCQLGWIDGHHQKRAANWFVAKIDGLESFRPRQHLVALEDFDDLKFGLFGRSIRVAELRRPTAIGHVH